MVARGLSIVSYLLTQFFKTEIGTVLHENFIDRLQKVRDIHHAINEFLRLCIAMSALEYFVALESSIMDDYILMLDHIAQNYTIEDMLDVQHFSRALQPHNKLKQSRSQEVKMANYIAKCMLDHN